MLEIQRNLYVLRRWWWLLLAALLVGAAVAYLATKLLVQQQYQGTALISLAPPPFGPNGLSVTGLQASADAQLVPTLGTAQAALRAMPRATRQGIKAIDLTRNIDSTASADNQVLTVNVRWKDKAIAPDLTNAVATSFVAIEQRRLERRYLIIHAQLLREQQHLAQLIRSSSGKGPAFDWLQGHYADTATRLYQQDADARIQASMQENGLSLAQPASEVKAVGPRAAVNAILGAVLSLIVALAFAYATTTSYGKELGDERVGPVLAKIGE